MKRILKYEIDPHGVTALSDLVGLTEFTFRDVDWQDQKLVVWAEVGVDAGKPEIGIPVFVTAFTGEDVPDGRYVGSAQRKHQELGHLVVHVYVR